MPQKSDPPAAPRHEDRPQPRRQPNRFAHFARGIALAAGSPYTFVAVILLLLAWLASGFFFHFSDGWQLAMSTIVSVFTLLMVLLVQSTQNRDSAAAQIKLNEIIRALEPASKSVLNVEELGEPELEKLSNAYRRMGRADRRNSEARKRNGKTPSQAGR